MGVYLTKPATEKFTAHAASSSMEYGASSMQGWRTSQEDAHCCHLDVDCTDASVFGVFDGHGGSDISRFCADRFLEVLTSLESYKSGDVERALSETFLALDKSLLDDAVRQQLMECRTKGEAGKNGKKNGALDIGHPGEDSEEDVSDASGDDPDTLKEEAQLSMADLIARFVKPKKASPFIHKKSERFAGSGSDASPVSSGRKRAYCPASKKQSTKPEEQQADVSSTTSSGIDKESVASTEKTAAGAETPESKNSSGLGSPPSEPEEKRPLIKTGTPDENVVSPSEDGVAICKDSHEHKDGKCPDGPLSDCKQKMNQATKKEKVAANGKEVKVEGAEHVDEEEEEEASEEEASDEEDSDAEEADEEDSEEDDDDEGDEEDQIYKEMMEDELKNGAGSSDEDDDDEGDEDYEERRARMKKLKAIGLLGGAALRRSILAQQGIVDDDSDEDEDESEGSEEDEDEENSGPIRVRGGPDIEFLSPPDERQPGVGSGATAIVAVIKGSKLFVANAGDSRCILFKQGKTVPMSFDHKPDDAIELERITRAGGRVTPDGRVMGVLNLSRAIGDHLYKRCSSLPLEDQMVSAKPDLKSIEMAGAEFMVLACDGIWNSMENDEVGAFVKQRIDSGKSLTEICSDLFDHCLAPNTAGDGTGCDNMTAVIVKFLANGSSQVGSASVKK